MQGGNFWHGAAAGGIGSAIGSAVDIHGTNLGWSQSGKNMAMAGGGALSGGISSSIAGGNFWEGFGIAATVNLVNHAMHQMGGEDPWEVVRSKTHEAGGRTDYFANGESVFYSAYGATQFYDATGTPTAFYPASGALRPTVAPYEFLIGSGFSIIGGGIVGVYGLRYYVGNFARLHPRVASDIYGGARVNAGKRGAAFMRK